MSYDPRLVGYLTVSQGRDGARYYDWRGGPQLLVDAELLAVIDPAEWDGGPSPAAGTRATLATFPVRVVGFDDANHRYVMMREAPDGEPQP